MPTTPPAEVGPAVVDDGDANVLVAGLVDRLHAHTPLRVWSLIVTIFGDTVAPRGGEIWAGTLQELLGAMRIDAAAVRAALSRLARDGWLDRIKVGRLSYYALSADGRAAFGPALARVYRRNRPGVSPRLHLFVLPEGEGRNGVRDQALKSGYGSLGASVLVGTSESVPLFRSEGGLLRLDAELAQGRPEELVARAFDLEPLAARYRAFVSDFTPLAEALEGGVSLADHEAMVARTLLIHAYRRLILRDPVLPDEWLPDDWPGEAARALTARLYALLAPPCAGWIARSARCRDGELPPPDPEDGFRFSN
jgi:phenylacetic acid degradation operon negative regulatory protein